MKERIFIKLSEKQKEATTATIPQKGGEGSLTESASAKQEAFRRSASEGGWQQAHGWARRRR